MARQARAEPTTGTSPASFLLPQFVMPKLMDDVRSEVVFALELAVDVSTICTMTTSPTPRARSSP